MENALGEAQTIVLLGGTSDIGRAIVRAADRRRRPARRARRPATVGEMRVAELRAAGRGGRGRRASTPPTRASTTRWCASSPNGPATSTSSSLAFGQLVDQAELDDDPARAAAMVTVNYTGAVSVVARRRRPVPPPGPRPPRRAVERGRRAGPQGQLRLRLVEGRARRRSPRASATPSPARAPACSSCARASCDSRMTAGDAGRRRSPPRPTPSPRRPSRPCTAGAARCGCRRRCVRCSACSATCPARSGAGSRSADR